MKIVLTCREAKFACAQGGDHNVLLNIQVLGYIDQVDCCLAIYPLGSSNVEQLGLSCTYGLHNLRTDTRLASKEEPTPCFW